MIQELKISEWVNANPQAGSLLYDYGVSFHQHLDNSVGEVLESHHLDPVLLSARLDLMSESYFLDLGYLKKLPLELLLAYLNHNHHLFVKKRLPYFADLVAHTPVDTCSEIRHIVEDLKLVFPLFREDFIRHIFHEEDHLFDYIRQMLLFLENPRAYGKMIQGLQQNSVQAMALHHAEEDDDMVGIRVLTKGYLTTEHTPLTLKVLYGELRSFEQELKHHAEVENALLFPQALKIEYKVNQLIHKRALMN